ncbi:hypothetical protein GTV32_22915 [Gordonia sp. SID5947]|uniref:SCO6880 family protein n=1 Tax=Gordonia sp. SID5947 TaxID=2690315 RepID=UPI00136903FF|nr:SCO6880 family protein [Gordonia sp. SID5947]MYR08988.1 hypothetical protein [Gordonia sp. SID5947]
MTIDIADAQRDSVRTAILGGEVASRYVGGVSFPAKLALVTSLLLTLVAMVTLGLIGLIVAVVLIPGTIAAVIDFGGGSIAGRRLHHRHERRRRRRGEHLFIGVDDPDYGNPDIDPGWLRPVPLGKVEPLDLTGTGLDDMFILWHHNPGEANYFSLVLSVQGLAEGLRSDNTWAQNQQALSESVYNVCARRTSHVKSLQMVSRSVPSDLNPHEAWITERVAALDPALAERLRGPIISYGELIDDIRPYAEDHRCYIAVCIGETPALMKQAARLAGSKGAAVEGGVALVIRDEVANIQRALQASGYGRVDVLGEQRACSVFRSFINPTYPLDQHEGVRWETCFPSYVGTPEAIVVRADPDDPEAVAWHTRVATVPPGKVAPVPLGPAWLAPMLTGVEPDEGDPTEGVPPSPTIRTLAVRMDFVPADRARQVAKKHRTSDAAAALEAEQRGRISDGTSEVMADASARRAQDLKEGSGYHGVIWSMSVSVTGRDPDDCDRACARVAAAADESAITELRWRKGDHDIAMFWTLPMGRGLATTRYTR